MIVLTTFAISFGPFFSQVQVKGQSVLSTSAYTCTLEQQIFFVHLLSLTINGSLTYPKILTSSGPYLLSVA